MSSSDHGDSLAFTLRIAGNLTLAASLACYVIYMNDAEWPFPRWVPMAGAFLGVGLIISGMVLSWRASHLARTRPQDDPEVGSESGHTRDGGD